MLSSMQETQAQKGVIEDNAKLDVWLLLSVVAVVCLGSVMVFSATIAADSKTLAFDTSRITKHLMHICLGASLLLVCLLYTSDAADE